MAYANGHWSILICHSRVATLHAQWYTDLFAIPVHGTIPELPALHINLDLGQLLEIPLDESFRQRVFDIALNGSTKRPCAVILVTAGLVEYPLLRDIGDYALE